MQASVYLSGRVITALIMFLIFLFLVLMALDLPDKARLMPLMIGIPGTVLGLVQLIMEVRTARAEAAAAPAATVTEPEVTAPAVQVDEDTRANERQMLLWTFLFFLLILCFGFLYAAPLLVFGFLYLAKSEPLKVAIIGGIGTWAVLFGVFETWFAIPLFEGLVIEWLTA